MSKPLILKDVSNQDYHKDMPGLSSSQLRNVIFKSPFHFKYFSENPAEDEYKAFYEQGTLIHTLMLEPDKVKENLVVIPEDIKDFRTKKAQELRDEALLLGKNVLLYKDYVQTMQMVESYRANTLVQTYLTGGEAELSMFWTDKETGLRCKCRPDYLYLGDDTDYVIDVKSTADIDTFMKSVFKYNYHVAAAHYLEGIYQTTGKDVSKFYLLALSKKPPYDIELFMFSMDTLEEGRAHCRKGLNTLKTCFETNCFPNKYGQELRVIENNWRKQNDTSENEVDCCSGI